MTDSPGRTLALRWLELYNDGTPESYGSMRQQELFADDIDHREMPTLSYPNGRAENRAAWQQWGREFLEQSGDKLVNRRPRHPRAAGAAGDHSVGPHPRPLSRPGGRGENSRPKREEQVMTIDPNDRQEILDLISKYSYAYDTQDWEMFASIWADSATWTAGSTTLSGREGILSWLRPRREGHAEAGVRTNHYQTNTLLTAHNHRIITGLTMVLIVHWQGTAATPVITFASRYRDEFVRTADGWRIASRRIEIDQP